MGTSAADHVNEKLAPGWLWCLLKFESYKSVTMTSFPSDFWLKHGQMEGWKESELGHWFLCPPIGLLTPHLNLSVPKRWFSQGIVSILWPHYTVQFPLLTISGLGMLEGPSSARLGVYTTCLCWKTFYYFSVFIIRDLFKSFIFWFNFDRSYMSRNLSKFSTFSSVLEYKFS